MKSHLCKIFKLLMRKISKDNWWSAQKWRFKPYFANKKRKEFLNHRCAVCTSIGKLHQISGQLSVVHIRWTFMGLEGAVNGVHRTRTFSILVQSLQWPWHNGSFYFFPTCYLLWLFSPSILLPHFRSNNISGVNSRMPCFHLLSISLGATDTVTGPFVRD